jgi:MoaA/NifB/PqqE/SkfB family radical SAM enzyme
MFENLLSGRRLSPVSVFLALTSECPYHCWHCSYKKRPDGGLSTIEWRHVISELHALGASIIGFTGGEPCSRSDLAEIITAASQGGAATILFSSGACMDEPLLRRLKGAGLWSVCLSLDHPDPAIHDKLRGASGAHARALRMLRCAKNLGFYTMAGAVGTRELIPLLPELRALAGANGAHELRIVEPMPCGLLASAHSSLLNDKETAALRRFHVESNKAGVLPKVCAFNQIESPEVFGCGAGTQHMFIDARGEVCPCDFTGMSFGRVASEPLALIWSRMNDAMGNPRRHCFVRKHHALISKYSNGTYPLSPDLSARVCAEAGQEELPDYFQQMLGKKSV